MLSNLDTKKKAVDNSDSSKLLTEVETISKGLYVDKSLSRLASSTASSRSKSVGKSHLAETKTKGKDVKSSKKDSVEKEKDKDKKASIWSWKGLKALTIRNRKFNCCFSLLVHSIEGLPPLFDDVCLVVHWKRKDGEQMTSPVRVYQGVADFEEQLIHSCSVSGSRNGPHNSAKYEAKHFMLYTSVYDSPELDLGKHRIDMTRLLPLTLEELDEEKSSGKWTTSYRLSGKARGATLNVSFGYVVIGNNCTEPNINEIQSLLPNSARASRLLPQFSHREELINIRRTGSLPARSSSTSNHSMEDIKDLHEVLPLSTSELSDTVNILYKKMDEEMANGSVGNKLDGSSPVEDHKVDSLRPPDADEKICETDVEISEFSVVDKGIEDFNKEQVISEDESPKVALDSGESLETETERANEIPNDDSLHPTPEESDPQKDEHIVNTCISEENEDDVCSKEDLLKELETALTCASNLVDEELDSQDENEYFDLEDYEEVKDNYEEHREEKSPSLDDDSELVANDFLDMLGIEHSPFGLSSESEPESPREYLLRQFENDALANGGLLNFEMDNDSAELGSVWETTSEEFHHSLNYKDFEEMPKIDIDTSRAKSKATRIEDLETEALMLEWGLNEKVFQHSPPGSSCGFGSPIDIPPEDPQQLPPLAEGLGPFVQTENGGYLRSMNPVLFKNARSGGSLIMQVSSPVVVPAEMGSGVMEILQGLASVGIEKLSMQANKLMPLDDVNGKTIQQIAFEAAPSLEGSERHDLLYHESETLQNIHFEPKSPKGKHAGPQTRKCNSSLFNNETEYVSLEDLAPLAMDKIEALSIEGLRIQSGLSDEDAPSNISAQSMGDFSALKGKTADIGGSIGLDGACGLQLMDVKDNGEDVDGLMGLSLTLDEWMKLDSGEIDDDDLVNERTSKILAAHHATSLDHFRGRSKGEKRRGKGRKYGLLGNNFTVALMVQLRDPLRNYEPVGTPMLALIQVERVFIPPKPRIYSTVSLFGNSNEEDEEEEENKALKKEEFVDNPKEEKIIEELIPQYKITEVHVAGLKAEPGKKKLWGSSTNKQQTGSRWLLANGMGKKNKHPLMKSKAVAKSSGSGSGSSPSLTTTVQPGETLWSISSRIHGTGSKWKELAALNPHIRNPNVIFPNETIRLC